jgi:cytochrome c peroxidase
LVDNGDLAACPSDTVLLDRAVATFKTPGLRDLGHSAPYMHTGQFDTLEQVVSFYQTVSAQARDGRLRNADPRIGNIAISGQEVTDIAVFLKALNEDYN